MANFEVTQIVKQRRNNKGKLEYLVRWKNYTSTDDTWEPVENLRNCVGLLDKFHEHLMQENKTGTDRKVYHKISNNKNHSKSESRKTRVALKRKRPSEKYNLVIKKDKSNFNGQPVFVCNGVSMTDVSVGGEPSPSIPSSSSSTSTPTPEKTHNNASRLHRALSMSCVPNMASVGNSSDGSPPIKISRRRVNSLCAGNSDFLSTDAPITTPPSTPTSSLNQPAFTPLLTPVIKLRDCGANNHHFKLPSPKSLLSTEKFLKAKLNSKQHSVADKFARHLALRELSQSGLSSNDEEEEEPERRFSLRQCDNVFKYKEIVVSKSPEFTQIWFFPNSKSRNGLNIKALQELNDILNKCSKDDTKLILLTGSGSVFCSGLDLQSLIVSEHRKKLARRMAEALRVFINTLINFPKVIVAAVNGSAVGLGAAILPLCDVVYSSDKAEFQLPYAALGQPPEGCSSFTFPNAMGLPVACDLLYSGRRITALEACASGLVSQVLWPTGFMSEVIPRVRLIASNSSKGLQMTKSLIRSQLKSKLEYTNESECAALAERWGSHECSKLIRKHLELK